MPRGEWFYDYREAHWTAKQKSRKLFKVNWSRRYATYYVGVGLTKTIQQDIDKGICRVKELKV